MKRIIVIIFILTGLLFITCKKSSSKPPKNITKFTYYPINFDKEYIYTLKIKIKIKNKPSAVLRAIKKRYIKVEEKIVQKYKFYTSLSTAQGEVGTFSSVLTLGDKNIKQVHMELNFPKLNISFDTNVIAMTKSPKVGDKWTGKYGIKNKYYMIIAREVIGFEDLNINGKVYKKCLKIKSIEKRIVKSKIREMHSYYFYAPKVGWVKKETFKILQNNALTDITNSIVLTEIKNLN